jgi:two-component system, sensor histidine kinase and response regulator
MTENDSLTERRLLERLSIATQAAGIFVWELNWRTNVISWDENRLASGVGNRHYGQELGADLFQWVHPEDLGIGHKAVEEALAQGSRDASFRYRLRLADGSIRHIQAYARTMTDEAGRPVRSLGVSWDVTAEIEAAEQLHDAQRRLERASLSIHEGHWELDLITEKHWASSSYYQLLGYAPDELDLSTLEKVRQLFHPDDHSIGRELSDRHRESGTPYTHETRVRHKDGTYRWFQVRARAESDDAGRMVRLSGSVQDIHKQKLAEDALAAVRQRFERAIRGTQDGLWDWDLLGQSFWVSPRYEAILGFAEGEVSGVIATADGLVHADDLEPYRTAQRAHFEQGVPFDVEVRMRTRTGAYRWVRMRGEAERNASGRALRLAGSMQDVTEARAARDALIQASEAAQAASRSKSAFLANVSHEIRTPMNGIIGMTSLLLDTALDRAQRDYAETIHASANSLLTVINDILDFSKIEAGRLDIESVEMDLPASIAEVHAILAFQAAAKSLSFEASVDAAVPRWVMGDRQRIRQCLINLVSNAIKFTPTGTVTVQVIAAQREPGQVLARFEVRDTGIGIAPETLPALFQPFVQADSSTTRHFGGTGLGLSIVRRLVDLMGGELGVESQVGRGSLFWFLVPLPVIEARSSGEEEVDPASLDSAGAEAHVLPFGELYRGKVLLVEDNLINQKVARSVLARLGCDVSVSGNGLEAVHAFAQGRFDLVLIDLQMPLMDGYAATSSMRKLEQGRHRTPIVALTASAMSGQRERCLEAGMDDLLAKPLDVKRLQLLLERFGLRAASTPGEPARPSGAAALDAAAVAELVGSAPAAAPLDASSLEQLAGGDAEFLRELAQTFQRTSEALVAELTECAGRGERERLARAAHSLQGASGNIRAETLRQLCAGLESRAGALDEVELLQQVARVAAERQRVVTALDALASQSRKAARTV